MPVYFEYALKVSICLAVSFLFYALLLKKMTHYTWNRYFLLLFPVLSFIVPFIDVAVLVKPQHQSTVSIIDKIPTLHSYEITGESAANPGMFIYWQILTAVFVVVSFILGVRLFVQFLSVRKIKSKATLLVAGKENIYHVPGSILPFSFLNNIFINTNNYSQAEMQEIIEHERVHVREKHSIDMLIAEAICILNWYNPFAWMIKNAVRENLEFIADNGVITGGSDKKNYQYLLLKVTGELSVSMASSFKFSSLKSRIVMMNKTKTSRLQLLKFALLAPLVTFLLLAFRSSRETSVNTNPSVKSRATETYTLSTLTYSIADENVKSIVIEEQGHSLLKPGELLNLTLISNEKDRLKNLLERNGYRNLKSNAIRFMIDTAAVNNSFSIEVKIDVTPGVASINDRLIPTSHHKLTASNAPLLFSHPLTSGTYLKSKDINNKNATNSSLPNGSDGNALL